VIPVRTFEGKDVAVFGLGRSGIATCKALMAGGARVCAWDDNENSRKAAEAAALDAQREKVLAENPDEDLESSDEEQAP
jgi:UDP-N-acetylmuramoylalanine--D-glutamate ligase